MNQSLLRWTQHALLATGCTALGYWTFVTFQARFFQAKLEQITNPETGRATLLRAAAQSGAPFARIEIPRIGISAIVVEGVAPRSLSLAVGHIPGTAYPDEPGNVALAGHRDTFFRKLGDIRGDDEITLTTVAGVFHYSVDCARVVEPQDIDVLDASDERILTLVTCYPFYYVGPAPHRFIVRAKPR